MIPVLVHHPLRARARRLFGAAAVAGVIAATLGGAVPASANHQAVNCAVGGNLANGGTGSVGCSIGGFGGAAIAGTIDVSDPAMTVAGSYGCPSGQPAVSVAAHIDVADPGVVLAGSAGGDGPYYPAGAYASIYP